MKNLLFYVLIVPLRYPLIEQLNFTIKMLYTILLSFWQVIYLLAPSCLIAGGLVCQEPKLRTRIILVTSGVIALIAVFWFLIGSAES